MPIPKMILGRMDFHTLQDIVRVYDSVVKGNGSSLLSKEDLNYAMIVLRTRRHVCWKFGSKLTERSFLNIENFLLPGDNLVILSSESMVVQFRFGVHADDKSQESEELSNEFDNALSDYLDSRGLLVTD